MMRRKLLMALAIGMAWTLVLSTFAGCDAFDLPRPQNTTAESESTSPPVTEAGPDYFDLTRIDLVKPDEKKVIDMAITGDGYDIFTVTKGTSWGYRYGCTYLYGEDGAVDAYFACPGGISGEWDWISYRHSSDGGVTWGNEKIVLTPTQGSIDHFSLCDPGVVYFDGYYYLGYTTTMNSTGLCNNVHVARSKNPDGPFEKWNGNGWGGEKPAPLFYYDETWENWGMGEISFVELNGTLYIYYTNKCAKGDLTMVATADATNENWPLTVQNHGVAAIQESDSLDVKYVEDLGKFVAIGTGARMSPSSYLAVYESNDGIHFTLCDVMRENTYSSLHNAGISSRRNGHIRLSEDEAKLCVIYAYGTEWGVWNTRVQPISIALRTKNNITYEKRQQCLADPMTRADKLTKEEQYVSLVRAEKDVYEIAIGQTGGIIPNYYIYNAYFSQEKIARNKLRFEVSDPSIVTVDKGKLLPKAVGKAAVTIYYEDVCSVFYVNVVSERQEEIIAEPVRDVYYIYIREKSSFHPQLRIRVKNTDGVYEEFPVDKTPDRILVGFYATSEWNHIAVDQKTGIVTAKSVGQDSVAITLMNYKGQEYKVNVTIVVTDDPAYALFDPIYETEA